MEKVSLEEIVENTISGEWGAEEKKDENDIFVIRTADFCNDGKINYSNIIKRNITKSKIEEKSLKIGDIIVEKSGGTDKNPVGRVVLFDKKNCKCLANNFTQVLRIKKEYYYKFIFYQLFYKYKSGSTLQMFNKTTGIQNLQMKLYLNQKLNVCDKREQIKISNLLDKIQEIIDTRKKQIEELDELIKIQFVEMFGDVINNQKHFEYKRIDEISEIVTGTTPNTNNSKNWNGNIKWITPAEIDKNTFIVNDTERKITEEGKKSKSLTIMPKGTVLFTTRAPIGKTAIAGDEMCCNQGFKNCICKKDMNNIYLYFVLKYNANYFDYLGTGATFRELSKTNFSKIKISVPPIDLQNKFAEFVKQVDKQKSEFKKSLEEVQKLQESLMNKYFG